MSRTLRLRAVLLVPASLILAWAMLSPRSPAQEPGAAPAKRFLLFGQKPPEVLPTDGKLRKLQVERYNTAVEELRIVLQMQEVGAGDASRLAHEAADALDKVAVSALALARNDADRLRILEGILALRRELEKEEAARVDAGRGSVLTGIRAKYNRVESEIDVEVARAAVQK